MSQQNQNKTYHELTALAKIRFEYTKGDKDSKALGGLTMLYSEGEIDENNFVHEVDGQKLLNKKGVYAMQRVLSYALAQNIKHLENQGYQKPEDRDKELEKMVAYIKRELKNMDKNKNYFTALVDPSQLK